MVVDTTDLGYQIGYQIGSWLPFAILVLIATLLFFQARKRMKKQADE